MKIGIFFLILMQVSLTAMAIDESPSYLEDWNQKLFPQFLASPEQEFTGKDNVLIRYRKFESATAHATLVLIPGRSEAAAKYAELISDLNADYNIFIYDHRGQGASERMLGNKQIGYVEHFNDYAEDLNTLIETVVSPFAASKSQSVYILAHSMGAAIASLYLEQHLNSAVKAAVFSSPMYHINLSPYADWQAKAILELMLAMGNAHKYVMGYGPYNPKDKFEENKVSHSSQRYTMNKKLLEMQPELALGGPSYQWLKESLRAGKAIVRNAGSLKIPVMILASGEDKLVRIKSEQKFCDNVNAKGGICRMKTFSKAFHEIFMESDSVRNAALAETLNWFSTY